MMRVAVAATFVWATTSYFATAFRQRVFSEKGSSRVSRCAMAMHIPRSELRLGQSTESQTLTEQLKAVAFDLSIINLTTYLEGIDKPALEWFEKFLLELPADDDHQFELNVMNKLINSHASLFEYQKVAETSVDVSMKFSHVVEPWVLAALLLNTKKGVLKGILFIFLSRRRQIICVTMKNMICFLILFDLNLP